MKKHILSKYAKVSFIDKNVFMTKNTKETRSIENSDDDSMYMVSKKTVITEDREVSDPDDIMSYYTFSKSEETKMTKSIENSDNDEIIQADYGMKKKDPTVQTDSVESSDSDEFIPGLLLKDRTKYTNTTELSDPDEFLLL